MIPIESARVRLPYNTILLKIRQSISFALSIVILQRRMIYAYSLPQTSLSLRFENQDFVGCAYESEVLRQPRWISSAIHRINFSQVAPVCTHHK